MHEIPQEVIKKAAESGEWQYNLERYLKRTLGDNSKIMMNWDASLRSAQDL